MRSLHNHSTDTHQQLVLYCGAACGSALASKQGVLGCYRLKQEVAWAALQCVSLAAAFCS